MKKILIILASFCFSVAVFACLYKTENRTFAQTGKQDAASCNSNNISETKKPCDFSKYKTLLVKSLKVESLPQPEYSAEAKEKNLTGCVPVRILVDKEGKVSESCALDRKQTFKDCKTPIDDELFQKPAKEAALKANFDVRRLSLGEKDFFEMTIIYNFTPSEKKASP